jgi:translation elongation factor EF-Tu-like GTPase
MAPGAATNGRPTTTRTSELVRFATAGSVDDGKSTLVAACSTRPTLPAWISR